MAAATANLVVKLMPDIRPATWEPKELAAVDGPDASYTLQPGADRTSYSVTYSKYNPTPGTGRTGFFRVPPNNYPFYSEEEKYAPWCRRTAANCPVCGAAEWEPMYAPTKEQAEADRAKAYAEGVPHGYVAPGSRLKDEASLEMWVVSELHDDSEYGEVRDAATGRHSGGPFRIRVSPRMRIEELRLIIRDVGGIVPALQRLSYAGKHLDDAQRTLEHYGIKYWHQRFPHWPIKIRKC